MDGRIKMTLVQHYSFAIWKKIILFLMITVFERHYAFMALIPVRNNQFCHLMYWCNLFSKRGWKSDLYIEIQLSGFHETAVIFLWAKTCSTVDRRKINSHHVLKSTTICPKQQSHSEREKKRYKTKCKMNYACERQNSIIPLFIWLTGAMAVRFNFRSFAHTS